MNTENYIQFLKNTKLNQKQLEEVDWLIPLNKFRYYLNPQEKSNSKHFITNIRQFETKIVLILEDMVRFVFLST